MYLLSVNHTSSEFSVKKTIKHRFLKPPEVTEFLLHSLEAEDYVPLPFCRTITFRLLLHHRVCTVIFHTEEPRNVTTLSALLLIEHLLF
jgi:hypothetical protein